MAFRTLFRPTRIARAAACAAATVCCWPAQAQTTGVSASNGNGINSNTSTFTIIGPRSGAPGVTGFGDLPLSRSPMQASVYGTQQLADSGVATLGGLTRLDASLGDAYNADGYWAQLSSRGYALDNRFNYRRDGLPINAETAIALDNKERIEVLKGTSGIQAGSSAPGGLVNLVVKRPAGSIRNARLELRAPGDVLGAVDLGERFGSQGQFGVRVNAAAERLEATARPSRGERGLFALAADWQLAPDSLLQAEVESSHQRQPSVVGFSLLGNQVPPARSVDPRVNLNDQPWGRPVVLDGNTASMRWQQRLSDDWRLTAQAMTQRLKSDDRTAFPYGVYNADYECPQWCNRFAPDGTFTYWEYVSNNERRTSDAWSLTLSGQVVLAGMKHSLEVGGLQSRYRGRFEEQIFDIAGTGRIDGSLIAPPSAGSTDANTNRDERSVEWFARDAVQLSDRWQLWAGVRQTHLDRASQRTSPAADGLRATQYAQTATLPWLALAHSLTPEDLLYASWGQGLESDVAPNRARYTNAGQPLPALKSRQIEAGIKHASDALEWAATVFDITRPVAADVGACDAPASCRRAIDGNARHRGIEAQLGYQQGAWTWQASAMRLHAERQGSDDAAVNGQRPVNVPRGTLRLGAEYRIAALPGLSLIAGAAAETDRVVLPDDNSVRIPAWSRWDVGLRWRHTVGATTLVWRAAVDNVGNRRAWKESPYEFGHVYLYPLPPRTARASVQATF